MCRRLWRQQGASEGLLFANERGQHLERRWLRRYVLDKATEAAGVPWVTFHTFRHTCASLLFAAGKSPKQVQMWLGHTDPAFTLRVYVHLMDDGLGDADFMHWPDGATDGATRPTELQPNDEAAQSAENGV